MAPLRTAVIAGAGIGGLTAAAALALQGFRVTILDQAARLEAIGAGIQLSPNAARVLIDLGLGEAVAPFVVAPEELRVLSARTGQLLARAELGSVAAERYGAPYWVIHRGDLHTILRTSVESTPLVSMQLGIRVEDFAIDSNGVTVAGARGSERLDTAGSILVGADGLWSALRQRLGHPETPRFAGHTAWRALIAADTLPPALRQPAVSLWLGRHAHVVHYPVRGGSLINVVAIVRDDWREPGWSVPGDRDALLARLPASRWQPAVRDLIAASDQWRKWALHDCPPFAHWGSGPVTLLGDAAHPMLPYLAQGGAMAIEDAVVLARCLAGNPDDPPRALRRYEGLRSGRTARAQRAAHRNGLIYHMGGAGVGLRTLALLGMRATGLLRPYDWLYRWKPD